MSDTGATTTEIAEQEAPHAVEQGVSGHIEEMLPGEVRPHPSPVQYVVIAVILVVITSFEIALYYAEDAMPRWLLVTALMVSAFLKFVLVASWYMHLRTDQVIFRRFFMLGVASAIVLYLIVLATFNVFSQ